jgi:hypothetical protein
MKINRNSAKGAKRRRKTSRALRLVNENGGIKRQKTRIDGPPKLWGSVIVNSGIVFVVILHRSSTPLLHFF